MTKKQILKVILVALSVLLSATQSLANDDDQSIDTHKKST